MRASEFWDLPVPIFLSSKDPVPAFITWWEGGTGAAAMESQDCPGRVTRCVVFQGSRYPRFVCVTLVSPVSQYYTRSESNSAVGHESISLALNPKTGISRSRQKCKDHAGVGKFLPSPVQPSLGWVLRHKTHRTKEPLSSMSAHLNCRR